MEQVNKSEHEKDAENITNFLHRNADVLAYENGAQLQELIAFAQLEAILALVHEVRKLRKATAVLP